MSFTQRSALVAAAALFATAPAMADRDGQRFVSQTFLSGAQEVADPGVVSEGRSRATIRFNRDFSEARIRVSFRHLEGEFTRLHLHCNIAGRNGPIAIGLVDFVAPAFVNQPDVQLVGHAVVGTITNANFPRPFSADPEAPADPCIDTIGRPVNNIASLAAAIDEGGIYWNLHSTAFPPGELRGQVRPLEEQRRDDRD